MGMTGLFFRPHPSNLVRINFELTCKNAEILVMISSAVTELMKIRLSVQSISREVLAYKSQNFIAVLT